MRIKVRAPKASGTVSTSACGIMWHACSASMAALLWDNVSSCEQLCLWLGRAQQHVPDACKDGEGEGSLCTSKEDETFMNRLDAEVHRVNR